MKPFAFYLTISYPITDGKIDRMLRRARSWNPVVRAIALKEIEEALTFLLSDSRCWQKYKPLVYEQLEQCSFHKQLADPSVLNPWVPDFSIQPEAEDENADLS